MVNRRLYRLAFLPALLALVIVMFSLDGPPAGLEPSVAPVTFEGDRATLTARQIAERAPEREAGSAGDEAIADLVAERFEEVRAGTVSEQLFSAPIDGEDTELRNVFLTLPGDAESTIVVVAPRDAPSGPGATSSAAATGVLLELADSLGVAGHDRTLVLASVTGAMADGAPGIRELLEGLPELGTAEAVVVISTPGPAQTAQPFVVASSTEATSPSVQLERTAGLAVEAQVGRAPEQRPAFRQLARLAFPSGLGGQAPLIGDGTDAVAISAAGERAPAAGDDTVEQLSGETLDAYGRAVQATLGAVDTSPGPLEHGPGTYLEISENLIPGWTLSLLALTLILPAGVAAVDALARAARRSLQPLRSLAWAAARALPFVGALGLLYALAAVGLIPRPAFPFDPGAFELGARAVIAFALIALAAAGSAVLLRSSRVTASTAPPAATAAVGALAAAAGLALWLANPYLALLAAPAAHVWLLAEGGEGRRRQALVGVAAVVSAVPVAAALGSVASALELGGDAPWIFTLMLADGQIGLTAGLAGCFLASGLVAAALLARQPAVAIGKQVSGRD